MSSNGDRCLDCPRPAGQYRPRRDHASTFRSGGGRAGPTTGSHRAPEEGPPCTSESSSRRSVTESRQAGGVPGHLRAGRPGRGLGHPLRLARRDPLHPDPLGDLRIAAGRERDRRRARAASGSEPRSRSSRSIIRCASPRRSRPSIRSAKAASSSGSGGAASCARYDVYGVPYAESQARFRETLDILRQAWTGEPFTYDGTFHKIQNATVTPRPYQAPHPPLRMAATSEETFPIAGRLGLPIFVGLRTTEISDLQAQLVPYREAWRDAGHPGTPSVYLRIPVYASPDRAGREGGAAGERGGLLRSSDGAGSLCGRTRRRRSRRSPTVPGGADGGALV